jgi:hypothetical protein
MATVMDGLSRYADSTQLVSSSALAALMSTGGRFDLLLVLVSDPKTPTQRYISSTITYSVNVGSEQRTYVISSRTIALKE